MTFCAVFPNVLSRVECRDAIAAAEARGFEAMGGRYPAGYRDNDRAVRDDPALAAQLFERLRPLLPRAWAGGWTLSRLNPRFRFCRYRGGQQFTKHRDGAWAEGGERSWLTVMLYLNDAGEFEGGATRFYPGDAVTPRAGQAIVFEHALWHDGAPVTRGTKYVMRTDVMYARGELAVPATGGGVDHRSPGVATAGGGADVQNEPRCAGIPAQHWDGHRLAPKHDGEARAAARPPRPEASTAERAGDGPSAAGTPPHERLAPAHAGDGRSTSGPLHHERRAPEHAGDGRSTAGTLHHDHLAPAHAGDGRSTAGTLHHERRAPEHAGGGRSASGTARHERLAPEHVGGIARLHRERVAAEHAGYVWAVRALADGALVSGGRDGTVRRDGGVVRANLRGSATALLEVNGALWVGGRHGQLDDGHRAWAAHDGAVLGLERLADGSVVSCGADGAVRRWSPTGEPMGTLQQHGGWVWGVVADGGRLTAAVEPTTCIAAGAQGSRDGRVTCDDGHAWRAHDGAVTCLARLGDGWVTGGEDCAVRVWSAEGVLRAEGRHDDFVRCLAVLGAGRFASGSYDGAVVVWACPVT